MSPPSTTDQLQPQDRQTLRFQLSTPMSDTPKMSSLRRQKENSTGLDVFEAAHYFSGPNELMGSDWRTRRMSLDGSTTRPNLYQIEKQAKEKQPRSPGGRLASFLNSLFNQSSSRKKKPKKTNNLNPISEPVKEHEDEQRRKRRSSTSHFRTSSSVEDSVSTPTKSYKDFRSYSVAKSFAGHSLVRDNNLEGTCMVGQSSGGRKEEGGGGDESDSSSDLFELKNYDIGPGYDTDGCGSDLPVYETTKLERIQRSTAI